ncbi:DUF4345 domain-containing protein [Magnetovibrio sp.]|uniref:DUF4345 domain-containing protein n=1 Tax=Magnetovibrio sp. TaxID=2024836 RepID=UPI002F924FAD
MNKSIATKTFLAISGIILIGIGGALLFAPEAFQASSGIDLGGNINLLSETRATGGLLFSAGFVVVLGAFKTAMAQASVVLSSLIYLSYGASRILSMVMDGVPDHSLVAATGAEIILGTLGLLVFLISKETKSFRQA